MSLDAVRRAVEAFSGEKIGGLDAAALLYATWIAESGGVANPPQRYESSYDTGGRYAREGDPRTDQQRFLLSKYGRAAAMSWGPFQIMPVVAWELGYKYAPSAFNDPTLAAQVVLANYRKRFAAPGGTTPEEAYDAYNSGTYRDTRTAQVQSNVARFIGAWQKFYSEVKPALPAVGGGLTIILLILAAIALARKPAKPK